MKISEPIDELIDKLTYFGLLCLFVMVGISTIAFSLSITNTIFGKDYGCKTEEYSEEREE